MYKIKSSPGRTIIINEKEFLYFSGTAYLGIPGDVEFRDLVIEGFDRYGTNFGGSRLSNIRFDIFDEMEVTLQKLTGAPAAISASSGTLAGQLLAHYFYDKAKLYATPDAHPAMLIPGTAIEKLGGEWKSEIVNIVSTSEKPVLLFANSVNVLDVQKTDFSWVREIPSNKTFILVVDDSHYLGIGGNSGGGIYGELKTPENIELIVVSSLGKAFGIPAGIILGSKKLIDSLWNTPLFGGASPTVLAYFHAFVKGQQIYTKNRLKLEKNNMQFEAGLNNKLPFRSFENFPVYSIKEESIAEELMNSKILLSSFRYPSPTSPLVTRVVISSLHTEADIQKLLTCLG